MRVVHRGWVVALIIERDLNTVGRCRTVTQFPDPALRKVPQLFGKTPHRARKPRLARDHVVDRARVDLGDRYHHGLRPGAVPGDERVKPAGQSERGRDRVGAILWKGRMAAISGDHEVEFVDSRHDRSRARAELAEGQLGCVVERVDLVDVEAVHDAFVHHDLAAAALFLRGLEEKRRAPPKRAGFGQITRRAQQHRCVPVMPAGMHLAVMRTGPIRPRRLDDGQRIHVRPERHRGPRPLPFDHRDDPGLGNAFVDLVHTHLAQALRHERGGLRQLEAKLRVLVQPAAPGGHVV